MEVEVGGKGQAMQGRGERKGKGRYTWVKDNVWTGEKAEGGEAQVGRKWSEGWVIKREITGREGR